MISKEWLYLRYVHDLAPVAQIAIEAGCGESNIRRCLKIWSIRRGKTAIVGKPAWNSGLTKEDDERIAKLSNERTGDGNPMFGKPAWNSGLTKETDERVASISKKLTNRDVSEETRVKQSLAKTGICGELSNRFIDGMSVYENGYLVFNSDKTYVHRVVAETVLKRSLEDDEVVHHIDGDKLNNQPSNLVVLKSASHSKLHASGVSEYDEQVRWLTANGHKYILLEAA